MQYTIVMPNYTMVCQTLPLKVAAVFGNPIISLREWWTESYWSVSPTEEFVDMLLNVSV